jgi:hypothetical protein
MRFTRGDVRDHTLYLTDTIYAYKLTPRDFNARAIAALLKRMYWLWWRCAFLNG